MTLSKEQLEAAYRALEEYNQLLERRASRGYMGQQVRPAPLDHIIDPIIAEIRRLKHGPFTLAEARVSGKLYRRPHWPSGCYYILQDADESSHMAFAECINNKKPVAYDEDRMDRKVFADDITATDYLLMTEDGDK